MAGTISIDGSQQFNMLGKPLGGGKIWVILLGSILSLVNITTLVDPTPGDTGNTGGGTAHNTVQQTMLGSYFLKM